MKAKGMVTGVSLRRFLRKGACAACFAAASASPASAQQQGGVKVGGGFKSSSNVVVPAPSGGSTVTAAKPRRNAIVNSVDGASRGAVASVTIGPSPGRARQNTGGWSSGTTLSGESTGVAVTTIGDGKGRNTVIINRNGVATIDAGAPSGVSAAAQAIGDAYQARVGAVIAAAEESNRLRDLMVIEFGAGEAGERSMLVAPAVFSEKRSRCARWVEVMNRARAAAFFAGQPKRSGGVAVSIADMFRGAELVTVVYDAFATVGGDGVAIFRHDGKTPIRFARGDARPFSRSGPARRALDRAALICAREETLAMLRRRRSGGVDLIVIGGR
jgi:hypothetical protein